MGGRPFRCILLYYQRDLSSLDAIARERAGPRIWSDCRTPLAVFTC